MSTSPVLEPIAVIGMACIFPEAPDLQAFWNNICGRVDAIGEPVPHWDAKRYLEAGRIKTPMGGWLKDLYRFDPREFGIMPNSMDGGEPDHFLALRVARDALADAGYHRSDFDHRDTGIILGHSTYLHRGQVTVIQNNIVLDQTMDLLQAALPDLDAAGRAELRRMLAAKLPPTNSDTAPGLVPNVMTGRIANRLNLRGPNYLVDAACSSSLLAVSAAMDELRAGRSRLMLAGGVNASLPADVSTIFTQLGALSARGKVRPFESGSDGTLLGEGLGVVVLKRISDALADGDRVYAVLRAVGQASDGRATGLLAPSVDGEALSIQRAYASCGVDPASVGLIEAHGTGIPLGDKTEIAALRRVFGDREDGQPSIAIGSVKSMISHCIPAAGIAGLIKTSLALHHRVLPPTLCDAVNPELGIGLTRLFVNTEAMPWIAAPDQPRRAGVDSFGFGGINTHAIVEQAPAAAQRPASLNRWPFELCLLAAESPAALADAVETLVAGLQANPGWQLDEIAAALASADRAGPARLALVVRSREALTKALTAALPKLRDAKAGSWSTRSGAFYGAEALGGKLAFIFPGEGSQYLGMLADLAMCFEPVRRWLDFWRGLYDEAPGNSRTDIAFPPAADLTPERRKRLEARLHDMDVGSEAVMVGGQAMFALLESLGVRADVMLGHSSGESSALAASAALPAHDLPRLAEFIRQMNAVYQRVLGEGKIPTGALLAVGALPSAMVFDTIAASGQRIEVAMDNCANQLVLYGQRAAIDEVQARLASIGGICMPLPFDRGYHTPDFGQVSEAFLEFYKTIQLGVPQVPLYSCASTQLFPAAPAAVCKLAAAQWSATVRFRETVQRMVDDGVRCFVEVGPSGNLSAFVDDILAEQPHLALATNMRRKPGLEQLLSALAQLWVRGYGCDCAALFTSRRIAVIDLRATLPVPRRAGLLDNTLPTLRLDEQDRALIQRLCARPGAVGAAVSRAAEAEAAPAAAPSPALLPTRAAISPPISLDDASGSDAASVAGPEAAALTDSGANATAEVQVDASVDGSVDARADVMADYFDLMRGFLAQQQAVLGGLTAAPDAIEEAVDTTAQTGSVTPAPFLDVVLEQSATTLRAECHLSVHRDAFLRDHVLSGRGSDTDPDLLGLACVPLMVSLEIMAEACALLAGGVPLSVIEKVKAFDWIALDDAELVLEVGAECIDAACGRYRASLHQRGQPAVTAEFLFSAAMPLPPLPALASLGERRPARWSGSEIYEIGMFHGPIFQSLAEMQGWDESGIDCELGACDLEGFFEPGRPAGLVLNPILLDAMGQLAACWIAEHVGTDFNCFPAGIARIELLAAQPASAPGVLLRGRQQALDPARAHDIDAARTWAFEAIDADGRALVRVSGLVNVFFHVPNRFYQARRNPLQGWLGTPLDLPGSNAQAWQLENLSEDFCAQSGGIFLRMLAHATLSFEEREEWLQLPVGVRRRRQWLLGRLAIKECVRSWLFEASGTLVYPSDVVVRHDEQGAPWVDGWWRDSLAAAPAVSLSHNDRLNLAALSVGGESVGVDVEEIGRIKRPELLAGAFTPAEQAWLDGGTTLAPDEAVLRLWCAKEAAAKFLGHGLRGAPEDFQVRFDSQDGQRASVTAGAGEGMIDVLLFRSGNAVVALAEGPSRMSKVAG